MSTAAIAAGRTAPLPTYGQHGRANAAINDLTDFFRKNDPQGGTYPVNRLSQGEDTFKNLETFISRKQGQLTPALHAELKQLLGRFATETQNPGMYRGGVSSRLGRMGVDTTLQGNGSASAPAGAPAGAPAPSAPAGAPAGAGAGAGDTAPGGTAGAPSSIPPGLQQVINTVRGYNKWGDVPKNDREFVPTLTPDDLTGWKTKIKTAIYPDEPTKADPEIDNAPDLKTLLQKLFDSSNEKKKVIGKMILADIIYSASQPAASQPPAPLMQSTGSGDGASPLEEAAQYPPLVSGANGDEIGDTFSIEGVPTQ